MVTKVSTEPPVYYGLSGDTKPTAGVPNGSVFIEVDTQNAYFFDEAGASWHDE